MSALIEHGLLRLGLPGHLGGSELALEDTLPIVRAIAEVDGSTGWVVHVLNGGANALLHFSAEVQDEVLGEPDAVVALAGSPLGSIKASRTPDGYRFQGRS